MIGEMRRLISLLAAALVAGSLATAGVAMAGDHHGGGGGGHEQGRGQEGPRWNGGGGRGAPAPQPYRGGGEYRGGDRGGGRVEHMDPRGDPRSYSRGEYRAAPPAYDPRYYSRGYGPPPSAYSPAPRRGGYLGPQSGGEVIQDYGRFRLRAPPRGYAWVHTPGGMALVSQATGQVFDVVPND
jgi:Ni/Co efflux regulator RcnB